MAGLPFQQMPAGMTGMLRDEETGQTTYIPERPQAQGLDYNKMLSSQLEGYKGYLQQQYDAQWEMLRKTSRNDQEFRAGVDRLIAKTDMDLNKAQYEYQQQIRTIQNIQKMTQQGLLSHETGKRATDKMAGIPTPKQVDWRTEHGRTFAELRRINAILTSKNSRGKSNFPKTWRGKDYAWDKMSPQKQQDLQQMLNVQQILQEQQQELFRQLPRAQQKAFGIQNATMRKSGPWLITDSSGRRHFNVRAVLNTPEQQGTFGEKIAVDMPKPKMQAQKQNLADPLGIR